MAALFAHAAINSYAYADSTSRCQAPLEFVVFKQATPGLEAAIRKRESVRIVALGSSSTQGAGATSKARRYPARLQVELRDRFPKQRIEVVNLGVGGELASDMSRRIESQVLPLHPTLVVWQTGVNDAIRNVGLQKFRQVVRRGIRRMREQGIDIVLLDQQYYPGASKLPSFRRYLLAMSDLAKEEKIPLLSRFKIMRYLVSTGQYDMNDLLAQDKFHLNDVAYRCLGAVLADALEISVKQALHRSVSSNSAILPYQSH